MQYQFYNQGTDYYRNAGNLLAQNANDNEVIFTNQKLLMEPQVVFYAQRNVRYATDTNDAKAFLQRTKQEAGVFVTIHQRADGVVIHSKNQFTAKP